MENKIVSTTYVPLQPPYQIIKWSGDIGMQIGTLVVTIQKEGNNNGMGYAMETHSHPVVTYEKKDRHDGSVILSDMPFMEGVVWEYVQLKDVTTLCLSTTSLIPWHEYCQLLWKEIERHVRIGTIAHAQPAMYWSLKRLGINIQKPETGEYVIHLGYFLYNGRTTLRMVRSSPDDIFPLNASAENDEELYSTILAQLRNYSFLLFDGRRSHGIIKIRFKYVDYDNNLKPLQADERLKSLVERLNSEKLFSKMSICADE